MENRIPALQIEYSTVCNMANICRHCYGATGVLKNKQTISEEVLQIILDEARYIAQSITITGGEPACFPEIVRRIENESELPILIMTNGIEFIHDVRPVGVLFSLDAYDVRPIPKIKGVLQNVLRYDCDLSCNTVLSCGLDIIKYYEVLKDAHKYLTKRKHGLLEWKLGFIIDKGKAVSNKNIVPEIHKVFEKLSHFLKIYFKERPFPLAIRGFLYTRFLEDEHARSVQHFRLNPARNPCLDCFGRGEILTINTSGHIQLCTVCRDVSVPIRDSLVDTISNLVVRNELTKYKYSDWAECQGCRYVNICGCGCPSLAMTYGGRWFGKDIFQCTIMECWEKHILPILPKNVREIYHEALLGS